MTSAATAGIAHVFLVFDFDFYVDLASFGFFIFTVHTVQLRCKLRLRRFNKQPGAKPANG
jgi:hypothetical protein